MTFYTLKPLKRAIKRVWEPFLRMFLSPFFGASFLSDLSFKKKGGGRGGG